MKLILILSMFMPIPEATELAPIILFHANEQSLSPLLVTAVIYHESHFQQNRCFRGAHGLMQIQLRSKKCTQKDIDKAKKLGLYNPGTNIQRGTKLMKWFKGYCSRKKHKHHWLLHYNQGMKVRTTGHIGGYARRVLRIYRRLQKRYEI